MRIAVLVQIAATLMMTGIIWFVQIVHYPLFARVGPQSFAQYELEHASRTGWVVGPLMCLELGTAILLLVPALRPDFIPLSSAWLGAVLVGVIWTSTAFIQVPLHGRLAAGYDAEGIRRLVVTNWIRTLAWSLRSILVLSWFAKLLRQG